jgi:hypothetical protein
MGGAKALAAQEYSRRVAATLDRVGELGQNRQRLNDTRSYGTLPSRTAGQTPQGSSIGGTGVSADCVNCGFDFSFGSYGVPK